jgi:serine/threonine protein kinase
VQVEIPVINELIHSVTCQNYQLKLDSRMIIDAFNKRYEDTLIDATNQKTGEEFSMKIVPFKSYTSSEFKRALYELWLHKVIGRGAVVRLMDYFIYGMNEEEQGFVLLFERCITNLANIAEYRKEARYGWMNVEKLKVFDEVLMSYQSLYEKNIIHRDLRPQNIFYVASTKRFAIGNLSRARYMRSFSSDDDLLTVEGIPHFSCK